MQSVLFAACGTLFTFMMTTLGAALVFLLGRHISDRLHRCCIGFAAGVMSAASVFSLLTPAISQARAAGSIPHLTVSIGFSLGAGLMLAAEAFLSRRQHAPDEDTHRRSLMLAAVTLHNIPEGMAVGLAFSLAARQGTSALAAAAALALGIGIQNIPEGAAISLPLRQAGMSRTKSFLLGAASGLVEPIFGMLVIFAVSAASRAMPLLMAFAAGAMMFVVTSEMIPEAAKERHGVLLTMAGYVIMMALDVALS